MHESDGPITGRRRFAPRLTTPDKPTINDTVDIRLVIKSEEVRMIAVSVLIKADAVLHPLFSASAAASLSRFGRFSLRYHL